MEDKEHPVHEEEVGLKHEREVQYDAQEEPENRTGLRRMLRRNPSYEFIRELAVMDETVLDQSKVKVVSFKTIRRSHANGLAGKEDLLVDRPCPLCRLHILLCGQDDPIIRRAVWDKRRLEPQGDKVFDAVFHLLRRLASLGFPR